MTQMREIIQIIQIISIRSWCRVYYLLTIQLLRRIFIHIYRRFPSKLTKTRKRLKLFSSWRATSHWYVVYVPIDRLYLFAHFSPLHFMDLSHPNFMFVAVFITPNNLNLVKLLFLIQYFVFCFLLHSYPVLRWSMKIILFAVSVIRIPQVPDLTG